MSDFEIDGHRYRISRLPTTQQLEVTRRYSAVLVFIGDVKAKTEKENPGKTTPAAMGKALLLAAADVTPADQQFVVSTALSAVHRLEAGDKAVPVREPASGRYMFEADMTPVVVCEMIYRVLDDHGLVDFFVDPPSTSPGTPRA